MNILISLGSRLRHALEILGSLCAHLRRALGRGLLRAAQFIRLEPSWNAEFWCALVSVGWGFQGLRVAARTHAVNATTMPALTLLLGVSQVSFLFNARTKRAREYAAFGAAVLWSLLSWKFCATHERSPTLALYVGEVGGATFAYARLQVERKLG